MRFSQFEVGAVLDAGRRTVNSDEIVEFARRYDPQPFHVDPQLAAASRWRGLIASGWHTCAMAMEMVVRTILVDSDSMGSPGIEHVRWPNPVRPGDELRLRLHILEARPSASGGTGVVRWRWAMTNQTEEPVLDLVATSLFDIRPAPERVR
jgi:acyl dehydratase